MPNQCAAANGLPVVRSVVAAIRERAVRSTAAAEPVVELDRRRMTFPEDGSSLILRRKWTAELDFPFRQELDTLSQCI